MICAEVPTPRLGAAYEDVHFTTSDGLRLQGWFVPSRNGATVIVFPGRSGPQKQARMLIRHGYGILLFDRRGEGASEGDPNLFGWAGERDLHAAAAYLGESHRRRSRSDRRHRSVRGGEMLIHAAAHSDAFKVVVSEGASGQSIRDGRANGDRLDAFLGGGRGQLGDRHLHECPAATEPEERSCEDRAQRPRPRIRRNGQNGTEKSRTRASTLLPGSPSRSGRCLPASTSPASPPARATTSGASIRSSTTRS